MEGLLGRAAFAVAGAQYRWADVIAVARHRGAWSRLEEEIRQAIACERLAADGKARLGAGPLWAAANEFRYQRRLTAAEEMDAWLARWHLTKDEWLAYLRRSLLRRRHVQDLATAVARYPVSDQEVADVAWATAVCSGRMESFARDLAARVVAMELSGVMTPEGGPLADLDTLESTFQDWCRQLASDSAVRKAIASHHLDWIRIESQWATFATAAAAREALMCVRVDGMDLADVSGVAGTSVEERRLLLEELEPAMRDRLVAATDGELLGPLPSPAGFTVVAVTRKTLPSPDDATIVQRAKASVVSDAIRQELASRVRWYEPL